MRTAPPSAAPPVVAILGGGFTGASTAFHLLRALGGQPVRIVVIEPRAGLGQGLAYSTRDPSHRINVPAARMTMDSADPQGLQSWLRAHPASLDTDPEARLPGGELFVRRRAVGDYVADTLGPALASGRIEHLRARAIRLGVAGPDPVHLNRGRRFEIGCDEGTVLVADLAVLALSHPPPGLPAALAPVAGSARLIADSTLGGDRLSGLARTAGQILIVGTGLTSADVIASLDRQGYRGRITALSRHGLRSRGHVFAHAASLADFATDPARSATPLLARIRRAVARDAAAGLPWQATLDAVRRDAPAIWAALPLAERARVLRHLRVWWDVHRFRIAPQPEAAIERRLAAGGLEIVRGRLVSAHEEAAGLRIGWRVPEGGVPHEQTFDAVVVTTGPAHGEALHRMSVLASAAEAGLIRTDPLRLGLDVADGCRALGRDGGAVPGLFVAGPLARAGVGELMGIPEVTRHAELVAARLAVALADRLSPAGQGA